MSSHRPAISPLCAEALVTLYNLATLVGQVVIIRQILSLTATVSVRAENSPKLSELRTATDKTVVPSKTVSECHWPRVFYAKKGQLG